MTGMIRSESLVSANVSWEKTNEPRDCLVTWEVSGGGLIGNLLTQSDNVELSLWPDTTYSIQVTCKTKVSFFFSYLSFYYHLRFYQFKPRSPFLLFFIYFLMLTELLFKQS